MSIDEASKLNRLLQQNNPKQGIFYDGQVFDAYIFVSDLIRSARKSIILIDNYIDESVLHFFYQAKQKCISENLHQKYYKTLKLDLENNFI